MLEDRIVVSLDEDRGVVVDTGGVRWLGVGWFRIWIRLCDGRFLGELMVALGGR